MRTKILGIFIMMLFIATSVIPNISSIKINNEKLNTEFEKNKQFNYNPVDYLINTEWEQRGDIPYDYNFYCPNNTDTGNKERLGCWSVAIAQIINYKLQYYSLQSVGNVDYWCTEDFIDPQHILSDLDATHYDWTKMVNKLDATSTAEELENVRRILYDTAIVIQKNFGTGWHFTTHGFFPDVSRLINELITHFPAINDQTIFIENPLGELTIVNEIDHSRPIMLYMHDTPGHAVVLDGYKYEDVDGVETFFVHLNYGWGEGNHGNNDPIEDAWYPYHDPLPPYDWETRYGLLIRYSPSVGGIEGVEVLPMDIMGEFVVETVFDTDPPLYYWFFWGDDFYEVVGPWDIGEACRASHSWSSPGIYSVKVKVMNGMGCESELTELFKVHVTRYRFLVPLIELLLDLKDRYPLLESIFNLIISFLCS